VEVEERPPKGYILRPGNFMLTDSFPGLPADGLTLTYDRSTALIHEDWRFLTWEHPMVTASMEMILSGERGNSALSKLSHPALQAGSLLLECMFVLDTVAPRALQAGRFLPPTLIRVLVDERFRDLAPGLPHSEIAPLCESIDRHTALQIVQQRRHSLQDLLDHGRSLAEEKTAGLVKDALQRMMSSYTVEIQRLVALQKVNPNVRNEEIQGMQQQGMALHEHLKSAQLRLDALRVIIAI
jgi:ATP-dependent helicase HepA